MDLNHENEPYYLRDFWLMLLGFPLHFWTMKILEKVANVAGKFIFLNEFNLNSSDKRVAFLLVEVDMRKGSLAEMDLHWDNTTIR